MFFCSGQLVVGNKISFGRTPLLTRLTLPAKSIINRTRIREARLPSKRYDLESDVYDVF